MNPRLLLGRLLDVAQFDQLRRQIADVPGWLDDVEGYLLHLLAAEGPGQGAIVEVGSWMGRSTCWLASGSKGAGRERVTAVDHFRGSPEHLPGGDFESGVLLSEGSTFAHFRRHLSRLGLWDHVTPVVSASEEAARGWSGPVRLVFIDADHSYEESRRDFLSWSAFVVPCGLVCFHDIEVCPGVTAFYRELLGGASEFQEVAAARSVRVLQRRPAP